MADSSVRLAGCLLALLTALSLALAGPVTAGVGDPVATETGDAPPARLGGQASSNDPLFSSMPPSPDADNTVTRIQVDENGTATWTLQIRTRLETDSETEKYRVFQERFRNNTSDYLGPFSDSITSIVGNGQQATGREMQARDFRASTAIQTVPRRWGVVTYEFTWTNFAETDGDRLVVGDIFQGGYFIAENDTLVISGPQSYATASVEPEPDQRGDGTVSWDGRQDFAGGNPHVEFAPATGQNNQQTAGNQATGVLPSNSLLGILGGLAVIVAGLVVVARRRGYTFGDGTPLGGATPSTTDGGATAESSGTAGGGTTTVSPDKKDRELLADVDKVTRVLEEAGGRMKQSEIGEELDWSKAKTSRVLSRLEDDGKIEKLRLGRENVIDLADDDDASSDGQSGDDGGDDGSDDSGSEYGYSP